ncbi:hypothetical protein [Symbiopectobacterium sp.]|uniref:hypothetical protein n=1 Tax=Symbiopectobacterium sp. TaxID=2952789 RepID=UPI003F377F8F
MAALAQLAEGAEAQSAEQRVAISQLVATALHILTEELDEKVQRALKAIPIAILPLRWA